MGYQLNEKIKRIVAALLVLTMVLSSGGSSVSWWFVAYAEEGITEKPPEPEIIESAPQPAAEAGGSSSGASEAKLAADAGGASSAASEAKPAAETAGSSSSASEAKPAAEAGGSSSTAGEPKQSTETGAASSEAPAGEPAREQTEAASAEGGTSAGTAETASETAATTATTEGNSAETGETSAITEVTSTETGENSAITEGDSAKAEEKSAEGEAAEGNENEKGSTEGETVEDEAAGKGMTEGESAEGEIAEGKTAEGETIEGVAAEGGTAEEENNEGKAAEGKTAEGENAEGESAEGKATGGEAAEGENAEGKAAEGETTEGESTEGVAAEGETAKGETTEGEAAEGEAAEGESTEGEAAEGETAEGETAEGETAENKVAEGESTGGEAAEGEITEGEAFEGDVSEGEAAEGEGAEGEVAEGEAAEGEAADGEAVEGEDAEGEAAEGEDDGEEAVEEEAGEEEVVEMPMLAAPALSRAVPVASDGMLLTGSAKSDDDDKVSQLQDMIMKAMEAKTTLTGRLQVMLEKKINYIGDVTISAQEREVEDDFVLELYAEDCGDDGNEGAGYTIIEGNLNIKGIKVEMKSIMMAADTKITVQNDAEFADDRGGSLLYIGTKNLANKVTLEVGKYSSAEIQMDGKDDELNLTVRNKAETVDVDMGEGLNTVNAKLYGGEVNIRTGDGADTVGVQIEDGTEKVHVSTGADYDALTILVDGHPTEAVIEAGSSDDLIDLDIRANAGNVTVNTGKGADTVNVSKGDHHTMENLEYSANENPNEVINASSNAVLTIQNEDETGIDRITIDAALSDAIKGIVINGENGEAVHFKGTLYTGYGRPDYNPITRTEDGFRMQGQNGNFLEISGSAKNSYTDALENKRSIAVSATGSQYVYDAAASGALEDFTDYVFNTPVSDLNSIIFAAASPLTLSNVVLDTNATMDEDDHLTVHDITATNMNVLLKGREIDINGRITARNVRAQSVQGTRTVAQAAAEEFNFTTFSAGILHNGNTQDMPFNMWNAYHEAIINVNAGAEVIADETITLHARVKQTGSIASFIPAWMNVLNWKQGDAKVTIDGKLKTTHGSILAEAKIQTKAGYTVQFDENGSPKDLQDGMPFALTVVLNDASVKLGKDGRIESGSDTVLDARSEIKAVTSADNGTVKDAPFAIAVSWIDNSVRSEVYGTIDAGRRSLTRAVGSIQNVTDSQHAKKAAKASGVYAALSIVDQDVRATIAEGATVKAGGDVSVYADANANIITNATSATQKYNESAKSTGTIMKMIFSGLSSLGDKIKSFFSSSYVQKKIDKMLEKVSSSDYSVKVIKTGKNPDKGTATPIVTREGSATKVALNIEPQAGWGVEAVRYRYLKPGQDHYTYETVQRGNDNVYRFNLEHPNAEVVIDWVEGGIVPANPDADENNNPNVDNMVNDAAGGAGNADEDEELYNLPEDAEALFNARDLVFTSMLGGRIVTWLETEPGSCLDKVWTGRKILFVPNPEEGKQLATLTVSYKENKDGKEIVRNEIVAPDGNGRYIYKVPDLAENQKLTVSATFEAATEKKETSHVQGVGAFAVSIVDSDNVSKIEDGAIVEAGGSIDMFNFRMAGVKTTADGTEIGQDNSSAKEENKPEQTTKTKWSVGGAQYALRINAVTGGTVTYKEGVESYHPVFEATPATGYMVQKAYISYYTKFNTSYVNGLRKTVDLEWNRDEQLYEANLMENAVVDGSTVDVTFVFAKIDGAEEYDDTVQNESQYVVRNPINISVNALAKKGENAALDIIEMGTVNYMPTISGDGKYYFSLHPNTAEGYTIDPLDEDDPTQTNSNKKQLFASYTDSSGQVQKFGLKKDPNGWYLSLGGKSIPAGAVVTVNAVFSEDLRDIQAKYPKENGQEVKNGKITFSKDQAKVKDKVKIKATPNEGYYIDHVVLSWVEDKYGENTQKTKTVQLDANGEAEFEMQALADSATMYVETAFYGRDVTLNATGGLQGEAPAAANVQLSEKGKGYKNEKVTVMPSDAKIKEGYRVSEFTISYVDDANPGTVVSQTYQAESGEMWFQIPDTIRPMEQQGYTVDITAVLKLKTIRIVGNDQLEHGKVSPGSMYVDPGELVTLNVEPEDGYRVKAGTLKVTVNTGSSSYQILATKGTDGKYTFRMPVGEDVNANTDISLSCEFEPGAEGKNKSLGGSIAVSWVTEDNDAQIGDAKVMAGDGVSMLAISVGGNVTTQSKAGFSDADTGFAGAISLQVAKINTRTRIKKNTTGGLQVDGGSLFMLSKGRQDFETVADASGKKGAEGESLGIGSGIAIAVSSVKTIAEVADGVKLGKLPKTPANPEVPDDGEEQDNGEAEDEEESTSRNFTGIYMESTQWTKDIVKAKAGAAGGSAWVPVAAVDVAMIESRAKLGWMTDELLDLNQDATILAESTSHISSPTTHEISADASSSGKSTAIGAAIVADWIENLAEATLNQSMRAPNVTISALAGDAAKGTAKASAAGGAAGKNDGKNPKGSADKQADQMLLTGGDIAAKSGVKSVSNNQMGNEVNNRQAAETSEESVAGAGALVLNMQQNRSEAKIKNGVNMFVDQTLSVKATNRTAAEIKADSSATKSDTGVGVSIAINIVNIDNIASIGDGIVTAGNLEVIAAIAEMPKNPVKFNQIQDIGTFANEVYNIIEPAVRGWLEELGLGDKASEFLSGLAGTAASEFVSELIRDTEIGSLLNIANDGGLEASFKSFFDAYVERCKDFLTMAKQPFVILYTQIKGMVNTSEEEYMEILEDIWNEAYIQFGGLLMESGKRFVKDMADEVINAGLETIQDKLSGKGTDSLKIFKVFGNKLKAEGKVLLENMIADATAKLSARIPLLTEDNIQFITNAVKGGTSNLLGNTIGVYAKYVSEAFREKVFDYEKYLTMYREGTLWSNFKDRIIASFKRSEVAVVNEAIDKVTGMLDVKLPKQSKDGRHIITTQAISGAGAKQASGAGSVAVAVINMDTKASIADSRNAVTVLNDGMLTVKAEEERRVRTVASAAVDAMGDADENNGVGNTDKANSGGSASAKKKEEYNFITVEMPTTGGTVTFDTTRPADSPRAWIKLDEGFKVPENRTITRTYQNAQGEKLEDNITIQQAEDGRYYFEPLDTNQVADPDAMKQHDVTIQLGFEEDLRYQIESAPEAIYVGEASVPAGSVTVGIQGRQPQEGRITGMAGDLVEVTAKRVPGLHVSKISYEYLDANGQRVTKEANVEAYANEDEAVFVFKMPAGNISGIAVQYEDGDGDAVKAKDGAGRSIGVGLSFAFTYGDANVTAKIGSRGLEGRYEDENDRDPEDVYGVQAGTVMVLASSKHEDLNKTVAGSDPLEGTNSDAEKKTGLDASVTLNILDNDIRVEIAEGTKVRTTAPASVQQGLLTDDKKKIQPILGGLIVSSEEESTSETMASAYATGATTAVGASVAVNVSHSNINTKVGSGAKVSGEAVIRAKSKNEDNTWAFASAMGADMQRYLNKFAGGVQAAEEHANKLTEGTYFDKKEGDDKDKNKTKQKINERLNENLQEGADEANNGNPASTNVLRSQGVNVNNPQEGNQAQQEAQQEGQQNVQDHGDVNVDNREQTQTKKLQVAAAVGFTWADHDAAVKIGGSIDACTGITITSESFGNFETRSTGVSMTIAEVKPSETSKTIAGAVAVSVGLNQATIETAGDIKGGDGDVTVSSRTTQNQDGQYKGLLAAQAVSLAVSGKGTSYSIAGSVGWVHSNNKSTVEMSAAQENRPFSIEGKRITISATDKARLGVRAGAIDISKGASKGAGFSGAVIISSNTVKANVGDNARIKGDAFDLIARKDEVTKDDFEYAFTWENLITDSSMLSDEDRENTHTGLIDVHREPGQKSYKVHFNANTYNTMKLLDALNGLSGVNYYTEAIAGSLMTGTPTNNDGSKNIAATVSFVYGKNKVNAALGKNARVELTGDMNMEAVSDSNVRLIGGDIAASKAAQNWGAAITIYYNEDKATAELEDDTIIRSGSYSQKSEANANVQNFNAAVSISSGQNASTAVGGTINIILMKNIAKSLMGNLTAIDAGGDMNISSEADMKLMMVSTGIAATGRATAVGGAVALIVSKAQALTDIGVHHALAADGDMNISAKAIDRMTSILVGVSAALRETGKAYAGAINVMVSKAKGIVDLDEASRFAIPDNGGYLQYTGGLTSRSGSIALKGSAESSAISATVSAAGGQQRAIGLSINGSFFSREARVNVEGGADYTISAAKDVLMSAEGADTTALIGAAIAGSTAGSSLAGNIMLSAAGNTIKSTINAGTIRAGGEAAFASHLTDRTYVIGGSIAIALINRAIGGALVGVFKDNDVKTDLGTASVTAGGNAGTLRGQLADDPEFNGVYVGATVKDTIINAAAGIALAKDTGVTANLLAVYNRNKIKASTEDAIINATLGGVTLKADADTVERVIAGGLNLSLLKSAGGGNLVGMYSSKDVKAIAGKITAGSDLILRADNKHDSLMISVNAGGGKDLAVEVGIAIEVVKNKVHAHAKKDLLSHNGDISVTADNRSDLVNMAAAVSGSMDIATSPVFNITWFEGETEAKIDATAIAGRKITLKANGDKTIDQYSLGTAVSLTATGIDISGAVTFMVSNDKVLARAAEDSQLAAGGRNNIAIDASGAYDSTVLTGAIAGGGIALAVNAAVGIVRDDVLAELAGTAEAQDITVHAKAERDFLSLAGTGEVGTLASVGATVLGTYVGREQISQDAIDALTYGNSEPVADGSKEGEEKTFSASSVLGVASSQGLDVSDVRRIEKDLHGDGVRDSDNLPADFDLTDGVVLTDEYDTETTQEKTPSEDAVAASIANTAIVTAGGNVTVHAEQPTSADMYGGAMEVGVFGAGIGATAAFAVFHSNVYAQSQGKLNMAGGKLTVNASSTASDVDVSKASDEQERMQSIQDNSGSGMLSTLNPTHRSIRAVSINAAGGLKAGVGIAAAIVRTDNVTGAVAGGTINEAGEIDVHADAIYDNILAAVLSAGFGKTDVAVSVAVASTDGEVGARLDGNTRIINQNAAPSVQVTTDTVMNANSAAAALGAGYGTSIVGGFAYTKNNLEQITSIDRGAQIRARSGAAKINVAATTQTEANAYNLDLGIGKLAFTIAANIANVKPTVRTSIGVEGRKYGQTIIESKDAAVTLTNRVTSKQDTGAVLLSAGYGELGGLGLKAVNAADVTAAIGNARMNVGSLEISSALSASGNAEAYNVGAGGAAIPFACSTVDLSARNLASIDTTGGSITARKGIKINTGDKDTSSSKATAMAGSYYLAGISIGAARAFANNDTSNIVSVTGSGRIDAGKSGLDISAYSQAEAKADVGGASAAIVDIAIGDDVFAPVSKAENTAISSVIIDLQEALDSDLTVNSFMDAKTTAEITLYNYGGLVLKGVNGEAYGKTRSLIDISLNKASTKKVGINVQNTAKDDIRADAGKTTGGIGVIGIVDAIAESEDVFTSQVRLAGGDYRLSSLGIRTDYQTDTFSSMTPSPFGASVTILDIENNDAESTNDSYAASRLAIENATVLVDRNVDVLTTGSLTAKSEAITPVFTISALSITSMDAAADLTARQAAELELNDGRLVSYADVNVESLVEDALADAVVSAYGFDDRNGAGFEINLGIKGISNEAEASENMKNTAIIRGSGADSSSILAGGLNLTSGVTADGGTKATADSNGAGTVSMLRAGGLSAESEVSDSFTAMMDQISTDIIGKARILARGNADAEGSGAAPGSFTLGTDVVVSRVDARVGTENDRQTVKVLIGDGVVMTNEGTLDIRAENKGKPDAGFSARSYSLGIDAMDTEQSSKSWYDTAVQIGAGAQLTSQGGVNIAAESQTDSSSVIESKSIGFLINASSTFGNSEITADNTVDIGKGAKISAVGDLNITAGNNTTATAMSDFANHLSIFSKFGDMARATNDITRTQQIFVDDDTTLISSGGEVNLRAASGTQDDIYTYAYSSDVGLAATGTSTAKTNLTSTDRVVLQQGVKIDAARDINLTALSTSHKADGDFGNHTKSKARGGGAGGDPEAFANVDIVHTAEIDINKGWEGRQTELTSTYGDINLSASNTGMKSKVETDAYSIYLAGFADAKSDLDAYLNNTIWLDRAALHAQNITMYVANDAYAELTALADAFAVYSDSDSSSKLDGKQYNYIQTHAKDLVLIDGNTSMTVENPGKNKSFKYTLTATTHGGLIDSGSEDTDDDSSRGYRNDFTTNHSYTSDKAEKPGAPTSMIIRDAQTALANAIEEALETVTKITRKWNKIFEIVLEFIQELLEMIHEEEPSIIKADSFFGNT